MTRRRGSSKLELLAAIMLIAAFAAVLLNRLAFYQEMAEKAKVEYTISILKSALRMQMATMLAEGRTRDYAVLATQNPMDWLEEKSADDFYISAATRSHSASRMAGQWQFDAGSRALVYWPARDAHLRADASGHKRIRLQVKVVRNTPGSLPAEEAGKQAVILAVRLEAEPYQWF